MAKMQFETARKGPAADARQTRVGAEDKSVVDKVDRIIQEAVSQGATEIHFEPNPERLAVRLRIKGLLRELETDFEQGTATNVVNRVKVLSGMDITKTKIPQLGFFKLKGEDRTIEMYAFVIPTLYGEATVVKVQYKQSATARLEHLGMVPNVLTNFRKALAKGSGLYLVTGPPGSGKRSTAYAAILEVHSTEKLVMGFDPVIKYEVPGMVQAKFDDRAEFTFAEGIEGLMKQEPDIAYIGDITSPEEARAAIQGAFARRIVICRMTANDSVNALQNILDMGVQSFLLAASISAIVNQRLLRRLCTACREPYTADEDLQRELGVRLKEGTRFCRPRGCPECEGSGYSGFQAIFEVFVPSEELNKMVVSKEPVQTIRQQALKEGMVSLKMDGIYKAMHGRVALEDVLNAL